METEYYHFQLAYFLKVYLILKFLIFPIPVHSSFKACTGIGLLEIRGDRCEVLLPSGRQKEPVNDSQIFQDCDNYLAYHIKGKEFSAWPKTQINSANRTTFPKYYHCPSSFNCTNARLGVSSMIIDCQKTENYTLIARIGMGINWTFSLSGCEVKGQIIRSYVKRADDMYGFTIIDKFPDEIFENSMLYSKKSFERSKVTFSFEISRIEDNIAPLIVAVNTERNTSSKILARSPMRLGRDKSIECSRSHQCENLVYISCDDKNANTYFILTLSIQALDTNPDKNETNLERVYEASSRATFDPDMIGMNTFETEYPKIMESFVVKSDHKKFDPDSWYLLFLEEDSRKLPFSCFSPDSKIGYPVFCSIPIPSGRSLKYVSITNGSLWMHTSDQGSTNDAPIPTCFLMNDCFGCVLIGTVSPFKCEWDSDVCTKSSEISPRDATDCVQISRLEMDNVSTLSIEMIGVRPGNTLMSTQLKLFDERSIYPNKIDKDLVEFSMNQRDLLMVQENLNMTYIAFNCSKFPTGMVEIALYYPVKTTKNGEDSDLLENLLIIILLIVLAIIVCALCRRILSEKNFSLGQTSMSSGFSRTDEGMLTSSQGPSNISRGRLIGSTPSVATQSTKTAGSEIVSKVSEASQVSSTK